MRIAIYSTRPHDRAFLDEQNAAFGHSLTYLDARLSTASAVLAAGALAASLIPRDGADGAALTALAAQGVKLIALRSTGFNHVDLIAAERLGLTVARVPSYSPAGVAEHTVALMLALNRHLPRAYNRVREGNFSLRGLMGFDMHGKTAGLIGAGQVGQAVARILHGMGMRIVIHDPVESAAMLALGAWYLPLADVLAQSEVISLHCPLTPGTRHLIEASALAQMRRGVMLINTGRGALLDTTAVIEALKSGQVGYLGLDVYEEEDAVVYQDLSDQPLQDDVLARLLTFPNVLLTGHQASFTREAATAIARTTLANCAAFEASGAVPSENRVTVATHLALR